MNMQLTGYDNPVTTTITSFLANLPELLGSMYAQGSRVLCIADFTDFRYVQFWAEGNTLVAEVISNMHIREQPLTAAQERMLLADGWNPPSIDGTPNFWMEVSGRGEIPRLTRHVQRAVVDVLGQGRSPELMTCAVKTWHPSGISYLSRDEARARSRVRLLEEGCDHEDEDTDR